MKRLIALLLILVLCLGMAACGKTETTEETITEENITEETAETTEEETTEDVVDDENVEIFEDDFELDLPILTEDGEFVEVEDFIEQNGGAVSGEPTATLAALQNIWGRYAEEERFAIMGGNPETGLMDEPGNYDMAYAENLTYNLLIPTEFLGTVTQAATMIHMMNANTFTCGAVLLAEGSDIAAFTAAVREAIQNNQWVCGFPQQMLISGLGDGTIIISFGGAEPMEIFEAKLTEAYPEAVIFYNEEILG